MVTFYSINKSTSSQMLVWIWQIPCLEGSTEGSQNMKVRSLLIFLIIFAFYVMRQSQCITSCYLLDRWLQSDHRESTQNWCWKGKTNVPHFSRGTGPLVKKICELGQNSFLWFLKHGAPNANLQSHTCEYKVKAKNFTFSTNSYLFFIRSPIPFTY